MGANLGYVQETTPTVNSTKRIYRILPSYFSRRGGIAAGTTDGTYNFDCASFFDNGKHLYQHIPEKIAHLEQEYPGVAFILTEHIGPDHLLLKIIEQRIAQLGALQ